MELAIIVVLAIGALGLGSQCQTMENGARTCTHCPGRRSAARVERALTSGSDGCGGGRQQPQTGPAFSRTDAGVFRARRRRGWKDRRFHTGPNRGRVGPEATRGWNGCRAAGPCTRLPWHRRGPWHRQRRRRPLYPPGRRAGGAFQRLSAAIPGERAVLHRFPTRRDLPGRGPRRIQALLTSRSGCGL